MKKKLAIAVVVVAIAWVAFEQLKGDFKTWYAINMMERATEHPAAKDPDHIVLTWSGDPSTTQTINWRTAPSVETGFVQYGPVAAPNVPPVDVAAERTLLEDKGLANDPINARYTATLTSLDPATIYRYRVGNGTDEGWSDWREFTTAPAGAKDFSFVYLGDPQVGLDYYGDLLHRAHEKHASAAFHVIAGDLVNSGALRNEWDDFFHNSAGVFDTKPLVPCLGNHDYQKQPVPGIYLSVFGLPRNGPKDFPEERAYSFTYGDALFIVLDSNLPTEQDQTSWLEEQLANSTATWKVAVYHHPAFNSAPNRDSEVAFDKWTPLFDKYHLDIALQGHDHAYMRTYPMRAGKRVDTAAEGTYYVVAVSGTKYYEQVDHDFAEKAFADTSTYQVIDIATNPPRLTYSAYDYDHQLRDSFTIEK